MTAHLLASLTEGFSLPASYLLAQAAELVYQAPEEVEAHVLSKFAFTKFAFCDQDDTQAFVATNASVVLVAFRGTESNRVCDWLADADVSLVDGPLLGKVHAGFYDALSHVWQILERHVSRFDPTRSKALWVTGHSLGAALATLAAARWIERGRAVQGLYTFGQPRVGDRTFVRNFDFELKANTYRFVNNNDLVTRLPPRSLGFSHQGIFKYFTDCGELTDDLFWWSQFVERWTFKFDLLLSALATDGIADHSMTEYRSRIGKLVAGERSTLRLHDAGQSKSSESTVANRPSLIAPRRRAA